MEKFSSDLAFCLQNKHRTSVLFLHPECCESAWPDPHFNVLNIDEAGFNVSRELFPDKKNYKQHLFF